MIAEKSKKEIETFEEAATQFLDVEEAKDAFSDQVKQLSKITASLFCAGLISIWQDRIAVSKTNLLFEKALFPEKAAV